MSVPRATDDAFWHRQFLAACYQLVQSVSKIGSALAERVGQGEVGGCTALADSAWRLLLMSGCGKGREPTEDVSIKL